MHSMFLQVVKDKIEKTTVKTLTFEVEVKAKAMAWTFDVKDETKFQSQILQFSIGEL